MDQAERSNAQASAALPPPDRGRRNLLKWTPGAITAGLLMSPGKVSAADDDSMKRAGLINVRDFGGIGDGKADDAPAIRRALDFAFKNGAGRVWVPAGNYALGGALPLLDGVHIWGDGPEATQLQSMGDFPVFQEIRQATNPAKGAVTDMRIVGGGKSLPNAHGIEIHFSNRYRLENLSFRRCRYGLSIAHAWQMFCVNLSVEGAGDDQNHVGWWMHETDLTHIDNAVQAVNCNVQGVEKYGFRLIHFQGSKFVNCEAAGVMEHGWYLGDPETGNTKVCWGVFSNCLADSTRSDGWRISKGKATDLKEIQLSNCWAGNTGGHGVRVQGADGIVFSNWLIIEPHQCGIELEDCRRVSFCSSSVRQFNKSGQGFAGINLVNSSHTIVAHNQCDSLEDKEIAGCGIAENGDSDSNLVTSNNVCGVQKRGGKSLFENNIGA